MVLHQDADLIGVHSDIVAVLIGVDRINFDDVLVVEVSVPSVPVVEILTFMVGVIAVSRTVICSKLRIAGKIGKAIGVREPHTAVLCVVFVSVSIPEPLHEGVVEPRVLERVVKQALREAMVTVGIDYVRVEGSVD